MNNLLGNSKESRLSQSHSAGSREIAIHRAGKISKIIFLFFFVCGTFLWGQGARKKIKIVVLPFYFQEDSSPDSEQLLYKKKISEKIRQEMEEFLINKAGSKIEMQNYKEAGKLEKKMSSLSEVAQAGIETGKTMESLISIFGYYTMETKKVIKISFQVALTKKGKVALTKAKTFHIKDLDRIDNLFFNKKYKGYKEGEEVLSQEEEKKPQKKVKFYYDALVGIGAGGFIQPRFGQSMAFLGFFDSTFELKLGLSFAKNFYAFGFMADSVIVELPQGGGEVMRILNLIRFGVGFGYKTQNKLFGIAIKYGASHLSFPVFNLQEDEQNPLEGNIYPLSLGLDIRVWYFYLGLNFTQLRNIDNINENFLEIVGGVTFGTF